MLCPVVTQRPHAVSVPERVSVVAAPCDWRDAEWSQRRVRPSVRACMGARVSFPDTGNSYESGVYVCLQSPGKVRNPPEVWSSGGGGGGGRGGSGSSSSNRDQEPGASSHPVSRCCGTPRESLQTSNRCGNDAWSPRGGRASLQGALSPPGAQQPLPSPESGCLLQLVGACPGRGGCPWRGLDFRSRRSSLRVLRSPRLHSSSRLLPPSPLRWHPYFFRAAALNDSWGPSRTAPRRFSVPGDRACL